MNKIKMSPPWIGYVNKVKKLFEKDPAIRVEYNEGAMNLCIYVDDSDKYEALSNLLPEEKIFGGVALAITIIPANTKQNKDYRYYLKKLFRDNNAVDKIRDITVSSNPMTFIVFEKEVVQYWNDNLGDINGITSTLMEQIARDVFEDADGVFFNTNDEDRPVSYDEYEEQPF